MNRDILIVVFFSLICQLIGQESTTIDIQYISPKPGSKFIMPGNNIALRCGQPLNKKSIHSSLLEVKNESGEKIEGTIKLSTDKKTLIYKPHTPYPLGETIQVELTDGLLTVSDIQIRPVQFEFTVSGKIIQTPEGYSHCYQPQKSLYQKKNNFLEKDDVVNTKDNNLPDGFPNININISNNPLTDEYIFFAPWTFSSYTVPFLIISDVYGTPIYYRKTNSTVRDLKVQQNSYISFAIIDLDQLYRNIVMDSTYQLVDFFQIGNGYSQTDPHDFQLLENGNAFVIAIDWQLIGMDTVVPGGLPSALVGGFIIQEQDPDKNVVFQWRSWDHFLITDAGPQIDLTGYIIDYVHGNAVEVESDTSILISSRSMDEITKIHRNTGDIIWRFGGKNNQFNVLNDTLGFTMQHDCRRLPNGHITLFDNGTMHPEPQFSSAIEYELDEENFEATLIKRLRNNPDLYGSAMGNAQWKSDQSVIVGWGNGIPGISEFSPDGEVTLEIQFQGVSYRAYRFPWETSYFVTSLDSLKFETTLKDSTFQDFEIINNNDFEIEISSSYNRNPIFSATNEYPLIIPAYDSTLLNIKFKPDSIGSFIDVLTINSDINTDTLVQRIAQQVYVVGNATQGQNVSNSLQEKAEVFPNPVHSDVNIKLEQHLKLSRISIYNNIGQMIVDHPINLTNEHRIDISNLSNGMYFIRIETIDNQSGLFKVVKQE